MADTNQDNEMISVKIDAVAALGAAYFANNPVPADQITSVIAGIGAAIDLLTGTTVAVETAPEVRDPAVPVRKSITPDFLICLEDGKKLKSMKRYLGTRFNMTPDEYRAKWGLSKDYPMVAPNYSKTRSDMAKATGLGKKAEAKIEAPKRAARKAAPAKEAATA